jgi:hypothetical protein
MPGTLESVKIFGVTYNIMAESDATFMGGVNEVTPIAHTGGSSPKRVRRTDSITGIILHVNEDENDQLKQSNDSGEIGSLAAETNDGRRDRRFAFDQSGRFRSVLIRRKMSEEQAQKIIEMPKKRRTLASREKEEIEYKFSEEVAEDQLMLFLDAYEIRESNFYIEEEKTVYKNCIHRLLMAVRKGRMTFYDDGTCDQVLQDKRTIHYGVLTGESKVQNKTVINASSDSMMTSRQYSMMGSLSGLGTNAIKKIKGVDLGIIEALSFLLSSV